MGKHTITRRQFLMAAAAGSLAAGVGPFSNGSRAWGATPKLKVGYLKNAIHHAPFVYLARVSEKYGFSVEILDFVRYADVMLALQKKQIDFGGMGYSNLPAIIEQKLDNVRAVAGNMNGALDMVMRTGVKLETWKDYEGKKIAVPANSIAEHHLRIDAAEKGFDINKVEIIKMVPGPAALIALKQREIDGISAWEPWVAKAVVEGVGYVPKLRVWDNSIGNINGVVGANREFATANRDLTLRFMQAMLESYATLTKNPEEHVKLAMSFTGIDRPVAAKAIENFSYEEKMYLKRGRAYAKVMHQYGLTQADTSERVHEAIDYGFLEAATGKNRRELGSE